MAVVLVLLLLVVAGVAVVALVVALASRRTPGGRGSGEETAGLPTDVLALRQEVAALRAETRLALQHLSVVRYDAFPDVGGQLSWSLAVLDDHGDGTVLTAIHGRNEARSYAKTIREWSCDQPLSPEEEQAVERARPR